MYFLKNTNNNKNLHLYCIPNYKPQTAISGEQKPVIRACLALLLEPVHCQLHSHGQEASPWLCLSAGRRLEVAFAKETNGQCLDEGARPALESIKINAEVYIRLAETSRESKRLKTGPAQSRHLKISQLLLPHWWDYGRQSTCQAY